MAHYLVTGGCGFIGSHLVAALEKGGHRVTVVDDLSTGNRQNVSSTTKVVVGTILSATTMNPLIRDVDGIFHLAAIASVERSRHEWQRTHETNLTGFVRLLERIALRDAPIPVVYASSAAVYGDSADAPVAETSPVRPLTAYGADKLGCELHAHVGAVVHGIPSTGLRFFNVYGPRQDPASPYSGVISIFCDRLLRGEPLEIYGDGHQLRDFVYVADVVDFLLTAMAKTSGGGAQVFNVCTGIATSILELANTIAELCYIEPQIRFVPARAGDIRISSGSDVLASRGLGIHAGTPIREGLAQTLRWLTEQRHEAPDVGDSGRLDENLGSGPNALAAGRRTAAIKNR